MPSYDVTITALAIRAPHKWTDNLLSQHSIADVGSAHRGVARRISHVALLRIALIRQLHVQLGISVADAVHLAALLLHSEPPGVHASGQLTLTVDIAELQRTLDEQLAQALESAPVPRRGRPPAKVHT